MSLRVRALAVAIAALASPWLVGSPAAALTLTPSGSANPYDAIGGSTVFTPTSLNAPVTCTSSALIDVVLAADGSGTIPVGNARYSGCSSIGGTWTVTQRSAWTVSMNLVAGPEVHFVVAVPAGGLRLAFGGCSFTASGTFVLRAFLSSLPGFFNSLLATASTLASDGNTGGLCVNFPVGLAVAHRVTYGLSQTAMVSG